MTPDQYRREGAEAMRERAMNIIRLDDEAKRISSIMMAIRAIDVDEVLAGLRTRCAECDCEDGDCTWIKAGPDLAAEQVREAYERGLEDALAAVDKVDVVDPCGGSAINDALRSIRALKSDDAPPQGRAVSSVAPAAWQPIETAPKDGSQFIFNAPQMEAGLSIGEYNRDGDICSSFDGSPLGDWVTPPTHWMPLPAPPQENTDE